MQQQLSSTLLGWHGGLLRAGQSSFSPASCSSSALAHTAALHPSSHLMFGSVPVHGRPPLDSHLGVPQHPCPQQDPAGSPSLTRVFTCFQLCSGGRRPASCTRSLLRAARTALCAATASSTAPRGVTSWAAVRHREPGAMGVRGAPGVLGTTDPPAPSLQCASHLTSPCSTSTPVLRASGCRYAAAPGTTPSPERPAGSWDFRSNSPWLGCPAWVLGPCLASWALLRPSCPACVHRRLCSYPQHCAFPLGGCASSTALGVSVCPPQV